MKEYNRNHTEAEEAYRQFYETQAQGPGTTNIMRVDRIKPIHWAIKELVSDLDPGAEILDVGVQHGKTSLLLSLLGYKVTAIDVAQEYINRAAENTKIVKGYIDFKRLEVEKLSTLNKKFDAVLCLSVLEHVKDFNTAINAVSQNIKPNGMVLYIVPQQNSWLTAEHCRTFDDENIKSAFPKATYINKIHYSDNNDSLGWYAIKEIIK